MKSNIFDKLCLCFWYLHLISSFQISRSKENIPPENIFKELKYSDLETALINRSKFSPLRIHVYKNNWDLLEENEATRLWKVVQSSTERISSLLSVQPLEKPLLLRREGACKSYFVKNGNIKKCAGISPKYANEFCMGKLDSFTIPNDHLDGIEIYNSSSSTKPSKKSIKAGPGVSDTDYILYVTTKQTHTCQAKDVIAYSSYCKLGENDRPVAGYVNVCPYFLKRDVFSLQKYTLAIIHELFHVLGFSADLFKYFKSCDILGYCYNEKVLVEEDGRSKIILPSVMKKMQEHFGCDNPDFGAVLDYSDNIDPSSHLDPLIFHYSVMAPKIIDPELTVVDPITLSLFEGTGWYKVNYSAADDYLWAKDSGCNLNKFNDCSYPYTCNISENKTGCNFNHSTTSECQRISQRHKCGVYRRSTQKCSTNQKCFIVEKNDTTIGKCMNYTCSQSGLELEVEKQWLSCPTNSQIDIQFLSQYETIFCQLPLEICNDILQRSEALAIKFHNNKEENHTEIWFHITSPTPEEVEAMHLKTHNEFKDAATRRVADSVQIPHSWIRHSKLHIADDMSYWLFVDFMKPELNEFENFEIIFRLQRLVQKGNITIDLHDLTYISALETRKSPKAFKKDQVQGLHALWILLGVIFIAAMISTISVTILDKNRFHKLRLTRLQKNNPNMESN